MSIAIPKPKQQREYSTSPGSTDATITIANNSSSLNNSLSTSSSSLKQQSFDAEKSVHDPAYGSNKPRPHNTFHIGVAEDVNRKCRRTMEDTHMYFYDFAGKRDQGYFAIFDGHAGSQAAQWCGQKFHHLLAQTLSNHEQHSMTTSMSSTTVTDPPTAISSVSPPSAGSSNFSIATNKENSAAGTLGVPEMLDQTFTLADHELGALPSNQRNSGCTAVVALVRWENRVIPRKKDRSNPGTVNNNSNYTSTNSTGRTGAGEGESLGESFTEPVFTVPADAAPEKVRMLYTANVGDARIVLWYVSDAENNGFTHTYSRRGRAVRLSYDHKGTDEKEGKRVTDAGGLILNARVNGVLAVTRALGDYYMKELVTGHPYTTETFLYHTHDEFIILACDGLWDVCTDQAACDLIREIRDPQEASAVLVKYALDEHSTDNLSCMVVRFD